MSDTAFNKLSPAEAERLAILAEECGEIIQQVGKVLRHGYEDWSPFDETMTPNRANLAREIGDFDAICKRMLGAGDLAPEAIRNASAIKDEKMKRWTHHQPDSAWASA